MSKYIIEIEEEPFVRLSELFGEEGLYRAKGFNSLVFDQFGLDKLTPLDKELEESYIKGLHVGSIDTRRRTEEAYQKGLEDGKARNENGCVGCKYDDGRIDRPPCDYCCNAYSNQWSAKLCSDEIKVGDIITDGKINYLVIDITDKSYVALQGTDFEPAYIGKDYIKSYHNLHDSKDMQKIAEEINKG